VRRGMRFGKRRKDDDEGFSFSLSFNDGEGECSRICGPPIDAIFHLGELTELHLIFDIVYSKHCYTYCNVDVRSRFNET